MSDMMVRRPKPRAQNAGVPSASTVLSDRFFSLGPPRPGGARRRLHPWPGHPSTPNPRPNLHFLGRLSDRQLQAVCRAAAALIVPSLHYEPFGLVIAEASRLGTPVLALRQGGMVELIEESGGGLTYSSDGELQAAVDGIVRNPAWQAELGQRALRAYQQRWTPEVFLARYLGLIRALKEKRGLPTRLAGGGGTSITATRAAGKPESPLSSA